MFYSHNPALATVFRQRLNQENPQPLMLLGDSGTGRSTAVRAYISEQNCLEGYHPFVLGKDMEKQCQCMNCRKIRESKTIDILAIPMNTPIEKLRSEVFPFSNSSPQELRSRYLLLRNVDCYPKRTLDLFLKLLEEAPAYLEIFLTAHNLEMLPPAIASRCEKVIQPTFPASFLSNLVQRIPTLTAVRSKVQYFPFKTLSELRVYGRLDLDNRFRVLFLARSSPCSLEKEANDLWDMIDSIGDIPVEEVREFVLRFFHTRLQEYLSLNCMTDRSVDELRCLSHHINLSLIDTLYKYSSMPKGSQFLNLRESFTGYVLAFFIARKSVGLI